MSYTITVSVYQTSPSCFFNIVEKICFNYGGGGTWSEEGGRHVLRMGASGTSGGLLFQSDTGERIFVVLGVHNYARWCDVVTGLVGHDTALVLLPQYYGGGSRAFMREKTLPVYGVTSAKGRRTEVKYSVYDGHELKADIIIG
ncbi:lectin XCL [Punctularia strigosozonata HHB-11173 SS5]|uniref:lectin XCL n=1 Tax=Punctularia strigosozonata (strain HHB-11173) TaxID=741275 RepID=UPI000441629F|nr:lectin XCL [Punctularia strigosozonata HHB-11173 SS5]EIN09377.1 lectin XCL [Punctularia strigosozonata HHB-11173 SS5]